MIKFHELQVGDYVIADNEGDLKRGEVTGLNSNEKQVSVNNGVQDFWYETDQLTPIAITDDELANLKFHKQVAEDGTLKYSKGAFRMLTPGEGDFTRLEIWYRDEQRHITTPINLHTLQNHFHEMTKVHLNDQSFD